MSDRAIKKVEWAEAAIARAATLAPLAEAAEPFFADREARLIDNLVAATSDEARAEYAYALKALRSLKGWLLAQDATGKQAAKELEKVR